MDGAPRGLRQAPHVLGPGPRLAMTVCAWTVHHPLQLILRVAEARQRTTEPLVSIPRSSRRRLFGLCSGRPQPRHGIIVRHNALGAHVFKSAFDARDDVGFARDVGGYCLGGQKRLGPMRRIGEATKLLLYSRIQSDGQGCTLWACKSVVLGCAHSGTYCRRCSLQMRRRGRTGPAVAPPRGSSPNPRRHARVSARAVSGDAALARPVQPWLGPARAGWARGRRIAARCAAGPALGGGAGRLLLQLVRGGGDRRAGGHLLRPAGGVVLAGRIDLLEVGAAVVGAAGLAQAQCQAADLALDLVQARLDHVEAAFHADHAERHEQEGQCVEQGRHQQEQRHPPGEPVGEGEWEGHGGILALHGCRDPLGGRWGWGPGSSANSCFFER